MTPAERATLIALATLGGWAYWNARRMAQAEAEVIAENIEHGFDEELPHDELVWWRIEWVGSGWIAAWMILAAVLLLGLDGSWKVALSLGVPLACVAWAVFTVTHRHTINKARGKDWRYVAPGNKFDLWWLRLSGAWPMRQPNNWSVGNWRAFVQHQHRTGYDLDDVYRKQVHRAGVLAYAFEVLVMVAGVAVALWVA